MKKYLFFLVLILLLACNPTESVLIFNENRAFTYLEEQCEIGFRYPGTPEIKECRAYISDKLKENGAEVILQKFEIEQNGVQYEGINIIGRFFPEKENKIILGAHYDTREWADKDSLVENHNKPVLGANDGASGVAVLLEMSNLFRERQPEEYAIDLVFFDLEDLGTYGNNDSWCLGSRYYADNFSEELPEMAIIVDMIGDRDLEIPMEYYSYSNSPKLNRTIWKIAKDNGFSEFKNRIGIPIIDDHYPLLEIGINAINIIDFDYKYWHTTQDIPENCSAHSLKVVGQTLTDLIYK